MAMLTHMHSSVVWAALSVWIAFGVSSTAAAASESAAIEEIPISTNSVVARTQFIAGQAAADRGDAPEANGLFRAAVAADPEFAYAWLNLALVSFAPEELAASLKRAGAAASKASTGEQALIEVNRRFLDSDFNAQLALSRQLVQQFPRSPRAWLSLAAVEANLRHFTEQRAAIAQAMNLDPTLVAAPLAMGNSYLFNEPRDLAAAEKFYRRTIELAPGEDNFYWVLGDVYRASNRLEQAREYYRLATLLDPHDGTAPLKLGHVDSLLGRYEEARADYDKGIANAEPANKPFYASYKMFTWVHAGEPRMAVDALEKLATQMDSMSLPADQRTGAKAFALQNAATVCLHTGMSEAAERLIAQLAAVLRASARAVGTAEFSRTQEAQIAYLEGQLAARRGDFGQAGKLAKKYATLVSPQQNPRKMENYHELLALIQLLQRQYGQAVGEYRQADLTNMYIKYHLALALDGAGQKDEARRLFKEVGEWNFNTVGYALVRKDALAKAG
jgi:tetratricopeptide (TPR) repeat protein